MWRASAGDLYCFWARRALRTGWGAGAPAGPGAECYVEVPTLLNWLAPRPPERVLCCGRVPSVTPGYVATRCGVSVFVVGWWGDSAAALEPGRLCFLEADAAVLPLAHGTLDAALVMSGVEHLADDASALREVARALRPGGAVGLSVPFATEASEGREREAAHGRPFEAGRPGFERIYDWHGVAERLIRPSGLRLEGRAIYSWPARGGGPAGRLRSAPLGLAALWEAGQARVVAPEYLVPGEHAVCCLLLRRVE